MTELDIIQKIDNLVAPESYVPKTGAQPSAVAPSQINSTGSYNYVRGRRSVIDEPLMAQQKAYTDNFRNTQSHKWADYYYDRTAGISNNIINSNFGD